MFIFSKKYRTAYFFKYCEQALIIKAFEQRSILFGIYIKSIKNINDPFIKEILELNNNSKNVFYTAFYDKKQKLLATSYNQEPFFYNLEIDDSYLIDYQKIKKLKIKNLKNTNLFPVSTLLLGTKSIPNTDLVMLIGYDSNKFIKAAKEFSHTKLSLDMNSIVFFFCFSALLCVFSIYSVFKFIKKINVYKINSHMFKKNEGFEFNHIKSFRLVLYKALKKIESTEQDRAQMRESLQKHHQDIKIGKSVAQIIHDIKSSLYVFDELLYNRKHNYSENIIYQSKISLAKIFSIIESLRDPNREKILNLTKQSINFEESMGSIFYYAKKKNVTINIKPAVETPQIYCDHQKLERCLQNLLKNAVDYCYSYCEIEWKLDHLNNFVIRIIDDGDGVPEHFIDKLFQWRSSFNFNDGTGLGLTYAKFVAELSGGSLTYTRMNHLTYFTLILPRVINNNSCQIKMIELEQAHFVKKNLPNNLRERNILFLLIENSLLLAEFKKLDWPKDIKCIYSIDSGEEVDLSQCFCIYTDTASDLIETALSFGVSVILHNSNQNKNKILQKILQLKKN
ncbi:sensor histidine kinase [Fluviispira multicolorata]|nr:HAMP domain-containing sensor histidine kinase [Fluviispira multicolorata]